VSQPLGYSLSGSSSGPVGVLHATLRFAMHLEDDSINRCCRFLRNTLENVLSINCIAMPNSVQKKLSTMFARVSLSEKGNSSTKATSKGISKRFSLGASSPLPKENMGGGDQEAMLTFIEHQGNQISQLKEHIASLEAKLLASPPGCHVKPAALLFSPIRGASNLSEVKSPPHCIAVNQAAFVSQVSGRSLNVVTSPVKDTLTLQVAVAASAEELSPMAPVQVMHFSQLSINSSFSTANGSNLESKTAIPFQEFVDSCLLETVKSPSAQPLLASFADGNSLADVDHGPSGEILKPSASDGCDGITFSSITAAASNDDVVEDFLQWIPSVVSFSMQAYWLHSVSKRVQISKPSPESLAECVLIGAQSSDEHDMTTAKAVSHIAASMQGATTPLDCPNEASIGNVACQALGTTQRTNSDHAHSLLSPCAVQTFHVSPNLIAASTAHVTSKVSPGFCLVSPIMQAANSNQASGNDSGDYDNPVIINGLVFSGMAKLPEIALRRIRHSRAEFHIVNGVAWVPDSLVDGCMLCEEEFSLFFRRHHCRFPTKLSSQCLNL
jgi:hypothetical protein